MKLRASHTLFSTALLVTTSATAEPSDWIVNGSNTARAEYYDIEGDEAGSPYQFDGSQVYDELNVNATRRYSPYKMLRGQLLGIANDSDYRFPDDGLQVERINLFYENGEGGAPLRAEGGDVFSYLSYRTFQRSIKGVQFEYQPRTSANGARHSLLAFSGANQTLWNKWDWGEDNSSGISWLVEDGDWGSANVNLVYNSLESGRNNALDQDQWVASFAGETNFNVGEHNLNFEGEFAYFDGDHAGDFNPADGQNRDDTGIYAELIGQAYQQLSYRLRFEEYGYDFRPRGSVVFNDRRSYEGHLGWRFSSGLNLRGRVQTYEDRWDSVNQLDTDIFGVDLTGELFTFEGGATTGRIRAFYEQAEDEFNTTDRDSSVIDFSTNTPFNAQTSMDVRLGWIARDDVLSIDGEVETIEVDASINRKIQWGDFSGSIKPGISYRNVDAGFSEGDEWSPTIAINLSNSVHTIQASLDYFDQSRDAAGSQSVDTISAGLHYHYRLQQHEIGIDANWYDREPNNARDTETNRVAVYWTWYFDKQASADTLSRVPASDFDPIASLDGPMALNADLLQRVVPGQPLAAVLNKLSQSGAPSPARVADTFIYEMQLLQSVYNRQRVALTHRDGVITKVALIVDFEDDGSARSAQQSFERVREELIQQWGAPDNTVESGDFASDFSTEINSNQLIRNSEWQSTAGVLRLGIPRRIDSAVRIEIQHASGFASARNTLWSINEAR